MYKEVIAAVKRNYLNSHKNLKTNLSNFGRNASTKTKIYYVVEMDCSVFPIHNGHNNLLISYHLEKHEKKNCIYFYLFNPRYLWKFKSYS